MDPLYLSFSGGNITKALQVAHQCFDKYTSISFIHTAGGWVLGEKLLLYTLLQPLFTLRETEAKISVSRSLSIFLAFPRVTP